MNKLTNQKILELALTSSDPLIKNTVDKLIFALKLKYSDDEILHITDNYEFHHSVILHIPNYDGDEVELSLAWKNEKFGGVSLGHQYFTGTAGDMVHGAKPTHYHLINDMNYTWPYLKYSGLQNIDQRQLVNTCFATKHKKHR